MCWTDKLYFSHKRVQLCPQRWPQNRLSCSQNRLTHFLRLEDKGTQAWRFWWLIPRRRSTNSVLNRLLAKTWAQNNLFREREEGRWANWHEAAEKKVVWTGLKGVDRDSWSLEEVFVFFQLSTSHPTLCCMMLWYLQEKQRASFSFFLPLMMLLNATCSGIAALEIRKHTMESLKTAADPGCHLANSIRLYSGVRAYRNDSLCSEVYPQWQQCHVERERWLSG